jgi:hypothetical protein
LVQSIQEHHEFIPTLAMWNMDIPLDELIPEEREIYQFIQHRRRQ